MNYVAQLSRRDGLAVGSEPVEIDDETAARMSQYQSPLVYQSESLHAYENSYISPVTHMIYEPAPSGEFFFWPQEVEGLALFLINEAGYEHIRKPWHPNRFISGRNHLLGREEFEMYGRTCPSHPTRPKDLPSLPFIDDRMKLHPAIPQEKHVSTLFGILHMGPFTESLVQDYVDEGAMMAVLNRFSHNALLLNNITGRPESSAFHFKRMPNPGEPLFLSVTVEYSPNKDKALICAGVFDSDLDGSYIDAKSVFKIYDNREFTDAELEFIDKQTLPSLVRLKHDLRRERLPPVSTSPLSPESKGSGGFLGGIFGGKS